MNTSAALRVQLCEIKRQKIIFSNEVKPMAKDGTNRGGFRVGAGRKPKAITEKIESGNPGGRPPADGRGWADCLHYGLYRWNDG